MYFPTYCICTKGFICVLEQCFCHACYNVVPYQERPTVPASNTNLKMNHFIHLELLFLVQILWCLNSFYIYRNCWLTIFRLTTLP